MQYKKKKIIVAMSGGVDSAVAAFVLKKQGYLVEGLFMKNWEEEDNEAHCMAEKDLIDAQDTCKKLGIILHTVNFSAEYWDNVFLYFLREYKHGCTPNPDILCNKEIKFNVFLKFAIEILNADYIATGHYVRRIFAQNQYWLLRGIDLNKDQSYFLYIIKNFQLARCLFPLGNFMKIEVRNLAHKLNLSVADKKDSTGICFIGKRNFRNFLYSYLGKNPGIIISVKGKKIGYHQGLMYYTIGQRKGLNIGGIRNFQEAPWYVVDKDLMHNYLIVAQGHNHPSLMSISLIVFKLNWISWKISLQDTLKCTVKIRYRQIDIKCLIHPISNTHIHVLFYKPVSSVAIGQSAVFYLREKCLGGGIIKSRKLLMSI
ncbi:MAG: tRNA-specific 2-thiouridylase [Candidatus Westeberhardia cardiocondylae]|nr:tRNA-specific 2-thiouridylase [Candidatus Westeberhardia cardiocondylae]